MNELDDIAIASSFLLQAIKRVAESELPSERKLEAIGKVLAHLEDGVSTSAVIEDGVWLINLARGGR
jgi:hypothetical protein